MVTIEAKDNTVTATPGSVEFRERTRELMKFVAHGGALEDERLRHVDPPIVSWQGSNRFGVATRVDFKVMGLDSVSRLPSVVWICMQQPATTDSSPRTYLQLTTDLSLAQEPDSPLHYVGGTREFSPWFFGVCSALEDGLSPLQIVAAAYRAFSIQQLVHQADNYPWSQVLETFCQELAWRRYQIR